MYLALCREGETARLPSGRLCVIVGTLAGKASVIAEGEEEAFEIAVSLLRHVPQNEHLMGARVTQI